MRDFDLTYLDREEEIDGDLIIFKITSMISAFRTKISDYYPDVTDDDIEGVIMMALNGNVDETTIESIIAEWWWFMPGVHRESDSTTGHSCPPGGPCGIAPPTNPASWSEDVKTNSKGTVRIGDAIVPHPCFLCAPAPPCTKPCPPHGGLYIGPHNVYANSRDVQVCTDPITCTDNAGTCSGNVYVN